MSEKRAKYTKEFRLEAIKLVTDHGYSQAEASRSLGVNPRNLNRWINEFSNCRKNFIQIKAGSSFDEEELQQLRKEVKRLRMEREILKKAAAFFANESR